MILTVHIKEGEPIDRALKKFKRKCDKVKLKRAIRDHRYFEKRSVTKRMERLKSAYIQKKRNEQEQQ